MNFEVRFLRIPRGFARRIRLAAFSILARPTCIMPTLDKVNGY